MSKKYQYFALKRDSHRYFEARTPCKLKNNNNFIVCSSCLQMAGYTRRMQKDYDLKKNSVLEK